MIWAWNFDGGLIGMNAPSISSMCCELSSLRPRRSSKCQPSCGGTSQSGTAGTMKSLAAQGTTILDARPARAAAPAVSFAQPKGCASEQS